MGKILSDVRQHDVEDTVPGGIAVERLRSIIERVEKLDEQRKELGEDISQIFQEAKSAGFDVKAVKAVIRIRKQKPSEVEQLENLVDLYRRALGM
ncbi:DUF2312 domain-containing protein [Teichococcus aestuarii]|uniref:DUF2312 domain-containing protein n=1 Tax=Teichococcus aestuarii TaxID=568898 RepID=UPI00360DE8AC